MRLMSLPVSLPEAILDETSCLKSRNRTRSTHLCVRSWLILALTLLVGCSPGQSPSQETKSLLEARRGFKTTLTGSKAPREPVEQAPPNLFRTITYPASPGDLAAYLSPDPKDGKKHPAIIWITGGDCNSIGNVWTAAPRANDQTAAAFRKAGIVMMFPSLRGGNNNPGAKEGFLGEADDVVAASQFLKNQEYVDAKRIYLGGHSTGGTLALLVAEISDRFRAVFAYGPVDNVAGYGEDSGFLPFNLRNRQEVKLRSPGFWLGSVQSPTWVFEGAQRGNTSCLRTMAKNSTNPKLYFIEVNAATHFTILAPNNELIAQKILGDTGDSCNVELSMEEVNRNFATKTKRIAVSKSGKTVTAEAALALRFCTAGTAPIERYSDDYSSRLGA
jgi:acetyl esterase/lipase